MELTFSRFVTLVIFQVLFILASCNGGGGSSSSQSSIGGSGDVVKINTGYIYYRDNIQPILSGTSCNSCHMGDRFSFTSLTKSGLDFSEAESKNNYELMLKMISLDNPKKSRLIAKALHTSHADGMKHRGGAVITHGDVNYNKFLDWIKLEKENKCPDCGISASKAYIAYVKQPEYFWYLPKNLPLRADYGTRVGAKIMLQPINPATGVASGSAIDFLGNQLCPTPGDCDYGEMAASYDGKKLVFECRIPLNGEVWLQRNWNICIADIGSDGKAVNPKFLMPVAQRHSGFNSARVTQFGRYANPASKNAPLDGMYDKHFLMRRRQDLTPIFSPDNKKVYLSSQRLDPRNGDNTVQAYHGTEFIDNIIAVDLDGTNPTTIFKNAGGTARWPSFLKNGNLFFMSWHLERFDQNMYQQVTPDGKADLPVFMGKLQGSNRWGKATETVNGLIIGLTGNRRGAVENFTPFWGDHTLGIDLGGHKGLDDIFPTHKAEVPEFGWCNPSPLTPVQAASTANCKVTKYFADANWSPLGGAIMSVNNETTHVPEGTDFYGKRVAGGSDLTTRQAAMAPYYPKSMGISLVKKDQSITSLITNESGYMYRFPVWVSKREAPKIKPWTLDESKDYATFHIANFPIWLSMNQNHNGGGSKVTDFTSWKNQITKVRVLRKMTANIACVNDTNWVYQGNNDLNGLHPTVLGAIDSTGFKHYKVPIALGGDLYGDIPLESDGSVKLKVPAGVPLHFQGIDSTGKLVKLQSRVITFNPNHDMNVSVKSDQYVAQCQTCHGQLDAASPLASSHDVSTLSAVMDFSTVAASKPAVDLVHASVVKEKLTFKHKIRPILDAKCISCHNEGSPGGDLSLQASYSTTGNYPPASWEPYVSSPYKTFVSGNMTGGDIKRSHNWSISYSYIMSKSGSNYAALYSGKVATHEPLAGIAPWDSGYQNLHRAGASGKYYYLNSYDAKHLIGRVKALTGNSRRSYLMEVLTGEDYDTGRTYSGSQDHTGMLTEEEKRLFYKVLDVGFPFISQCDEHSIPSGNENAGKGFGDNTSKVVTP